MSVMPLKRYFQTLRIFGERSFDKVDETSGLDLFKVRSLLATGCLEGDDASSDDGVELLDVRLTAQGAVVLAQWHHLLQQQSVLGKVLAQLEKFLWIAVGSLTTIAGSKFLG